MYLCVGTSMTGPVLNPVKVVSSSKGKGVESVIREGLS